MIEKTLNLAPRISPPIDSGLYTISVDQISNIDSCKLRSSAMDFRVQTDRIAMSAGEVYSVYPPKGSAGMYGECLPHIVLHRRTFPWERRVGDSGDPWIALLVIAEDERAEVVSMSYSESKVAQGRTLHPALGDDSEIDPDQECQLLTIPYALFADILPIGDDLPFLAHARGVNLDNKVTDPAVKGAWFSCVLANRYPAKPTVAADANATLKHTAYLVSLEGYGDYIYSAKKRSDDADTYDYAHFYVLYSWSFLVQSEGDYNFFSLANLLSADTLRASAQKSAKSVAREKSTAPTAPALEKPNGATDEGAQTLGKLLNLGFVPLNHYFREGSVSISWYHSPFLPQKPQWGDHAAALFLADQLLEYDPDMGMFDIRMAAAWQLGRLMALQDTDFSRKLLAWRLAIKDAMVRGETLKALSKNTAPVAAKYRFSARSTSASGGAASREGTKDLCEQIWRGAVVDLLNSSGTQKKPDVSPRLAALLSSNGENRNSPGVGRSVNEKSGGPKDANAETRTDSVNDAESPDGARITRARSQSEILALLDTMGKNGQFKEDTRR